MRLLVMLFVAFAGLLPPVASAQEAAALHIIVPTPPGGTNDGVARAIQVPLQKLLARPVIVDYKPGAASSLGSAFVARSKPDGNTLLLNNNAVLINPLISSSGYEMKDLVPVAVAAVSPMALIAHSSVPARNTRELIAYAAGLTEPLAYASSGGVGSLGHLAMESFARQAGIRVLHVAYSGGGPAQLAVSSGEVKLVLTSLNAGLKGQVEAGRLRLLGVAAQRPSPLVPGVPTIGEAVPGFELDAWFGLLAPAQTPADVVQRIAEAINQALQLPEVQQQLLNIGSQPSFTGPAAFGRQVQDEARRWSGVVREQNIRKD